MGLWPIDIDRMVIAAGVLGLTLIAGRSSSAAIPFATTGVYDETTTSRSVFVGGSQQTVINNVDFNASFSSGTGGATAANITAASTGNGSSYTTTGAFNSVVAAAFGRDRGGVIAFDNMTAGSSFGPSNSFGYGTSLSKSISVGFGGTYSVSTGVAESSTSISGQNYITHPLTHGYDITFGALTGASAGETGVIQAGFTLISEDAGAAFNYGLVSATATFSGGGTVTSSRTINNLNTQGDTFYGFVAPTGQTISEIVVTSTNDAPDLDDLAFTTEVPEPSGIFALMVAPLWLLRRGHRRGEKSPALT